MNRLSDWYPATLYEQAFENYRNEDDNHRVAVWQYLVFVAAIIYACSQAKGATFLFGILGLAVSTTTFFYLGRVHLYSLRWTQAKDRALALASKADNQAEAPREQEDLKAAMDAVPRWLSCIPGWKLTLAFPVVGAVLFVYWIIARQSAWT